MDKLARLCAMIDQTNEFLGKFAAWSAFALVITQFGIVLMNHLYSEGSIAIQESLTYMHSLLFLGAAGYTLLHNGHVRVDILYSSLSKRRKAYVNLAGTLIILFPVLFMVGFYALPYINASWQILEGSTESSGLHLVFLLKSLILLFVVSTFLQGISVSVHSIIVIAGSGDLVEGSLGEQSQ